MDASMTLKEKLTELIRDRLIYASGIKTGDLFQHTAEITVENIFMFLSQEGYGKMVFNPKHGAIESEYIFQPIKSNSELEKLEANGRTCRDCSHYSTCHIRKNKHLELPLCYSFKENR